MRTFLSPPHLSEEGHERLFLEEALASNWIAPTGPQVDAFEREFAEINRSPHAVAVSSGTAAIDLSLRLLGVGAGDDVLCSTFTFIGSTAPIVHRGAGPVFVDSEPSTWNLDPNLLEDELRVRSRAGRPLPKAAVVVDLYGQSADFDPIVGTCERYGVPIIEDAAEALGATYRGVPSGNQGALGVFSFNGNKIITTSGGGMLVCRDEAAAGRARCLSTQARDPAPHYQHSDVGYNYTMSNLLAAVGRGQLRVLERRVAARRAIFDRYRMALGDLPGIEFMPDAGFGRATRWLTCIVIVPELFGADRETVRLALEAIDVESRPLWKPMHLQPAFLGCPSLGGEVSARLFEQGLCLPSGSSLTECDQNRVVEAIRTVAVRGRHCQ